MTLSTRGRTFVSALALGLFLSLAGAPEASAAVFTTTIPDSHWCTYDAALGTTVPAACDTVEVTLTTDKTTYLPGETVTVTGSMKLLNPGSGTNNLLTYYSPGYTLSLTGHRYYISAAVNGVTKDLFNYPYGSSAPATAPYTCSKLGSLGLPLCLPSGTATFTAPAVNGTYNATCTAFIGQTLFQVDDKFTATIPPATCKASFTVASPLPNLTFGPINETTAVAGQGKVFTALLSNIGTSSTTAAFFNYLQRATAYNAATRVATGVTDINYKSVVFAMGPSRPTTTLSFLSYTVPAGDANTTKYFRACADNSSSVATSQAITESNENDNCGDWTEVRITAAAQANIVALGTTPSIASPVAGTEVTFSAQVMNNGTLAAGPVPNGFQLAFNAAKAAPYTWLTATQAATLGVPNGVASITSGSSFSTTTAGTYYIRACGNYTVSGNPPSGTRNTAISESSTTDNCDTNWVPVTVTPSPDAGKANLRVFERVSPQTATVGVVSSYSVPVYNTSTDTDVTTSFPVLLQKTNSIDAGGNPTTPVDFVNTVTVTTDVLRSNSATISVPTLVGTWSSGDAGLTRHLRICADKSSAADMDGTIVESNTEDNCGEWTPVSVAAAPVIPTVVSQTFSSVQSSSAVLGATVQSDGGSAILERGTCWSTTAFSNTCPNKGTTSGTTGLYTHTRSGLSSGRTIYFRGFATNAVGTGYSPQGNFATPAAPVAGVCSATRYACSVGTSINNGVTGTDYTWQCQGTNGGATVSCSEAILVPTVDVVAQPARVPKCTNTTLTWTTTQAPTSCTVTRQPATTTWPVNPQSVSGVSGSTLTDKVCENTKYEIYCTNAGGQSPTDSVIVNILPDFTEF